MSILLPPFVQERLTYTKQTSSKVRTTSKYVSKLQYYFIIPVFSIANTWKGASEIIKNPKIDCVVIATPAATHFKLAKEALEN